MIAILLAEQRHRTHRASLGLGHQLRIYLEVIEQHLVNPRLHLLEHTRTDWCRAWKVKPDPPWCILRTHLSGGITESLAKGPVNEVRRSVCSGDRFETRDIHFAGNAGALVDFADYDLTTVNE